MNQRRPLEGKTHQLSMAEKLSMLPEPDRTKALKKIAPTPEDMKQLQFMWSFWARPNQMEPEGLWSTWILLSGRGFGKTRVGAEFVNKRARYGPFDPIAIVGQTKADVRDTMVESFESSIMKISPPWFMPKLEVTKRRVTWPNGVFATMYSGDEPDQLRGPQHGAAWVDELCLVSATKIATEHGDVPIEKIKPGDLVWTRAGLRPVKFAQKTLDAAEVYLLTTTDGHQIAGTQHHPVFVRELDRVFDECFIPLAHVAPGSVLLGRGENKRLIAMSVQKLDYLEPVYNLEVVGDHEYFANGILTHNSKFKYPVETWANLSLGLRVGKRPQCVITTTPRPIPIIKQLVEDPNVVKTYGSTYDNIGNLPVSFIQTILGRYENTRLGAQEIYGNLLMDVDGALWNRDTLEKTRVNKVPCQIVRVVVAVDPAVGGGNRMGAETGIIVAGLGEDGHCYILDDASVGTHDPKVWAYQTVAKFSHYGADLIVAESNNGGEMVKSTIHTQDENLPVKLIFASKGKYTRAEPVSNLYSNNKVHHVGMYADLEDQLCSWTPGDVSPDRLDACVWAVSELMLNGLGGISSNELSGYFDYV